MVVLKAMKGGREGEGEEGGEGWGSGKLRNEEWGTDMSEGGKTNARIGEGERSGEEIMGKAWKVTGEG